MTEQNMNLKDIGVDRLKEIEESLQGMKEESLIFAEELTCMGWARTALSDNAKVLDRIADSIQRYRIACEITKAKADARKG